MQHRQQGFTLIELMIVITIIAILAAIAYPGYQSFVRQTREENVRADLVKNAQLLERYYSIHKTFQDVDTQVRLIKGQSDRYFTINFDNSNSNQQDRNNKYRLIASPNADNSINNRDIVYDSIDGMLACDKGTNQCTTF